MTTPEEDAQTAALQEYFESNAPAGYGASFRAGWNAAWKARGVEIELQIALGAQHISMARERQARFEETKAENIVLRKQFAIATERLRRLKRSPSPRRAPKED